MNEGGQATAVGSAATAATQRRRRQLRQQQQQQRSGYSSQQLRNDDGGNYGNDDGCSSYSYSSGNDGGTETGWAQLSKTEHARVRVGAMECEWALSSVDGCGGRNRVPEGTMECRWGYKYSTVPPPL